MTCASGVTRLTLNAGEVYFRKGGDTRLELKMILEELTRRLPALRLVPGQAWEFPPNTSFLGPAKLLVQWNKPPS